MINFFRYVLLFFFYSTAGWCVESLYCSIGEKRLINRGFLTGPMCPIYGVGALVMTVFLYNPYKDKPLMVFLLGMIMCDIVEYFTSWIMETLFQARWWDYTYEFMNIKGRICLKHTVYWGIGSVFFVYLIHPGIDKTLATLSDKTVFIVTSVILAVFTADVIHAVIKALDIRNLLIKLNKAIDFLDGGVTNIVNVIEDKYQSIQDGIDKSNIKINDAKAEIYYQISDLVDEINLRFDLKGKKENINKYSSRFFRNGLIVEKYTRKQLEKLKILLKDFKNVIFENDEKL